MKLNRKNGLLITACVIAVIIGSLGFLYFQQVQRQAELTARLNKAPAEPARVELNRLTTQKTDLETKLNEATSQLEALRAEATRQIVSSNITRTLFDIAKSHGLEITELVSSVPSKKTFEGVNFYLTTLQVRAEGDASKIVDFVTDLNASFDTGLIDSVNVTIPENSSNGKAKVDINMAIYTN